MDSRIQLLLEDEFLDRVITPIERYMTEKMTEEKITIAKTNTYPIIKKAIDEFEDVKIVYPIHKNPLVRQVANEIFKDDDKIKLIEPLDVVDFHNMMNKAYMILTDSGGVQEEAPSLGKPVLVLRNTTERPEALSAGTVKLVGTNYDKIVNEVCTLLDNEMEYEKMSKAVNPYGDGLACSRIVNYLR